MIFSRTGEVKKDIPVSTASEVIGVAHRQVAASGTAASARPTGRALGRSEPGQHPDHMSPPSLDCEQAESRSSSH